MDNNYFGFCIEVGDDYVEDLKIEGGVENWWKLNVQLVFAVWGYFYFDF